MKIQRVGAEVFHADRATDREMDGQTDMTKLIFALPNFANTLKIKEYITYILNSCIDVK